MKKKLLLTLGFWTIALVLICKGDIKIKNPAIYTHASWMGEGLRGKLMANGKLFNPDKLTCASWEYPLGTKLCIVYGTKEVVVVVTDRGPSRKLWRQGRRLDLSKAAFKKLAPLKLGVIRVRIFRQWQVKFEENE